MGGWGLGLRGHMLVSREMEMRREGVAEGIMVIVIARMIV